MYFSIPMLEIPILRQDWVWCRQPPVLRGPPKPRHAASLNEAAIKLIRGNRSQYENLLCNVLEAAPRGDVRREEKKRFAVSEGQMQPTLASAIST
jgi:hypothetical protein